MYKFKLSVFEKGKLSDVIEDSIIFEDKEIEKEKIKSVKYIFDLISQKTGYDLNYALEYYDNTKIELIETTNKDVGDIEIILPRKRKNMSLVFLMEQLLDGENIILNNTKYKLNDKGEICVVNKKDNVETLEVSNLTFNTLYSIAKNTNLKDVYKKEVEETIGINNSNGINEEKNIQTNEKNIILIDGNNLLNRVFYSLKHISDSTFNEEEDYNNIYNNFLININSIFSNFNKSNVKVFWDTETSKNKNKDILSNIGVDYKGKRISKPSQFYEVMNIFKKTFKSLGIDQYESQIYEADDLIANFIKTNKEDFKHFYIYSLDKDFFQLIQSNVSIIRDFNKNINNYNIIDEKKFSKNYEELVREILNNDKKDLDKNGLKKFDLYLENLKKEKKFFIVPGDYIYIKSLIGDKSDNIPGIKGFGEKKLLKKVLEYDYNLKKFLKNDNIVYDNKNILIKFKEVIKLEENIKKGEVIENKGRKDIEGLQKDLQKYYINKDIGDLLNKIESNIFSKKINSFSKIGF